MHDEGAEVRIERQEPGEVAHRLRGVGGRYPSPNAR